MKKIIFLIIVLSTALIMSYLLFAQDLELIFSHKYHAEEVEAACTDCHKADESALPADNLLPDMDGCYTCHDEEEECTKCHQDPDNAIVYPRITDYIAKFSHKQHSGDKFSCETCHKNVSHSENIMDKHLPKMGKCVECHTTLSQDDYCFICHKQEENLKPADHTLVWAKEHGIAAQTERDECGLCHHQNMCLDCHMNDNLDHNIHPLNYVNNHGLYAKGNKDNCLTCHEEMAFCMDCHRQRMVMPRNHAVANWSNTTTGGAHARAAKLDLDSCISCHSDAAGDPVCIQCHH